MLPVVTTQAPTTTAGRLLPLVADLVCVLVFAAAGKSSHEASTSEWVVLAIVWPFAVSVVVAHAGLLLARRQPLRVWPEGVAVLAVTYVLGMVLRVLSGRGIAGGFLVVAAVFLAVTLLGWRAVVRLSTRRR
jgi:FtsH-binding integral membrane protein